MKALELPGSGGVLQISSMLPLELGGLTPKQRRQKLAERVEQARKNAGSNLLESAKRLALSMQ